MTWLLGFLIIYTKHLRTFIKTMGDTGGEFDEHIMTFIS